MKLSVNSWYKALQAMFWMLFCVGSGFISMYLQGRGLGDAGIGTVTAIFGLLAAILGPVLGGIMDQSQHLTWRSMLLLLSVPLLVFSIIIPFVPGEWAGAIYIGFLILLVNTMMPFINTAHYSYTQAGEYVNFGVARGMGSALYAVAALLIGILGEKIGIEIVPLSGIVISLFFIFIVWRMPQANASGKYPREEKHLQKGFLRRYPTFTLMLLACLLMLTTHNVLNTYLLQIIQHLGGNSSQLGIALAIQAIVEVPVLFSFIKLQKRFRSSTLMLIAAIGFALKSTLYVFSGSVFMVYAVQFTQMLSFAIFASASVIYTSENIPAQDQTTGQAYMTSMIAAGTVFGSLLGGWVLELKGVNTMLTVNVAFALLGVVFAVISVKNKGLRTSL